MIIINLMIDSSGTSFKAFVVSGIVAHAWM